MGRRPRCFLRKRLFNHKGHRKVAFVLVRRSQTVSDLWGHALAC